MRVLYDHQVFSLQNAGGASRYHYELMRYLAGAPENYAELFLGESGCAYPFEELPRSQAHVTRMGGSMKPGAARYALNELLGNMWCALGRFDIYHPTLYRRMPMGRARRLVATHHDCVHERFPQLFRNAQRIIKAKRRLYAEADAIICVSESSRNDLIEFYGLDARKTWVIHHGLTPLPRSAKSEAELRTLVSRPYVLFVGKRGDYKGFDRLLRAFSSAGLDRSMNLVALGGGSLTAAEQAEVNRLGLRDCVISLPFVTDSLLAEAYAAATLFVYPSLYEGFGFPPLEAMALGCPALVSKTSSMPEVCLDAPFYFDPHDQSSFETALSEAVGDGAARSRAIARGKEVAAQYRWQKCGEQTLALYRAC